MYVFFNNNAALHPNTYILQHSIIQAFEDAQFPTHPFNLCFEHSEDVDSDQEMDVSFYGEEENFDKELFNKKTGEKLSVSFDGSQLEIRKKALKLQVQGTKSTPLQLIV